VPFDEIGIELRSTLQEARGTLRQSDSLIGRLNDETVPQLQATLTQLDQTLAELQGTVGRDAPLSYSAKKTLEELTLTLRSLRVLTETLDRQPQSVLFGKRGDAHD
jgi:paraquat-inducible protein B